MLDTAVTVELDSLEVHQIQHQIFRGILQDSAAYYVVQKDRLAGTGFTEHEAMDMMFSIQFEFHRTIVVDIPSDRYGEFRHHRFVRSLLQFFEILFQCRRLGRFSCCLSLDVNKLQILLYGEQIGKAFIHLEREAVEHIVVAGSTEFVLPSLGEKKFHRRKQSLGIE